MFGTDGEYSGFAAVAAGQFRAIEDHLRALRDVSEIANNGSGKVVHEVTSDGQVYFGANDDPGNTDETAKFPSRSRWCGAGRATTRSATTSTTSPCATCATSTACSTPTATAGRRASATSSARAWARRSSTTPSTRSAGSVTSQTSRRARATTRRGRGRRPRPTTSRSGSTLPGGSARPHGSTPTRWTTPGTRRSSSVTGSASRRSRRRSRGPDGWPVRWRRPATRTCWCRAGSRPATRAPTACSTPAPEQPLRRRQPGARRVTTRRRPWSRSARCSPSTPSIMAVAEAALGRMGADQLQRYTTGNAAVQLDPKVWELPGAMPEIAPSPDFPAEHRAEVHRAVERAAGVGRLRHPLAGRALPARRQPGHRSWPAHGRAAGAVGPEPGVRPAHQGGQGHDRRRGDAVRLPAHDEGAAVVVGPPDDRRAAARRCLGEGPSSSTVSRRRTTWCRRRAASRCASTPAATRGPHAWW